MPRPPAGHLMADTFRVGTLSSQRLTLRAPVDLHVAHGRVWTVSYNPWNYVWGQGDSLTEAVQDWGRSVREQYDFLAAHRDRLGPHLAAVWRLMDAAIVDRTPTRKAAE